MHKKSEETVKTASPTAAESKIIEDAKNDKEWEHGAGIKSQNKNDKAYIQTDAQVQTDAERKAKQTTNTSAQVAADLEKEKSQELIKPHAPSGNEKDAEPTNVQIKADVKVEEKK
jgi:hypothetical protein